MTAAHPALARHRTIVTPEGLHLPLTVASRGARIGALLLDFVFLGMGLVIASLLLMWIFGGLIDSVMAGLEQSVSGAGEFIVVVFILVMFLARYGYFLAQELGPRGATWGKRITGIRVAARDGGRLSAEAVIARNLLRDIELFLPLVLAMAAPSGDSGLAGIAGLAWFAVFMAFPFFNKDAMRAGDVIAGTWVVETPRTGLPDTLSLRLDDGARQIYEFTEAELAVYGEHELQTLERVLRGDDAKAVAAVHATICRKIGREPDAGTAREFLGAYYAQLRARLERQMRFGRRKADKFSA